MKYGLRVVIILSLVIFGGCTRINTSQTMPIIPDSRWGMAVFSNNTEVPQAGFRAMSITAGVLRSHGVRFLSIFPASNCNRLIVCPNATPPLNAVLAWAEQKHISYLVMGAVNEWDYKVGLDGEPIVGVALQIYNVKTGAVAWSSVGSKTGSSRSGLAVVAQALISSMLSCLKFC